MTPAGLAAIETAKQNGAWTALDDVETLAEPDDLQAALDAEPAARRNWNEFPRSTKRAILEWITPLRPPAPARSASLTQPARPQSRSAPINGANRQAPGRLQT